MIADNLEWQNIIKKTSRRSYNSNNVFNEFLLLSLHILNCQKQLQKIKNSEKIPKVSERLPDTGNLVR